MHSSSLLACVSTLVLLSAVVPGVSTSAIQITPENYEQYRASKDILFLNFYADWCRFSQALKPIFEKAAETLHAFEPDRVGLGRVDCDTHKQFCSHMFHITKYPTLKLVRHGQTARKEYRGARSTEAIVEFVKKQLVESVKVMKDANELAREEVKRAVVGYFGSNTSVEYENYRKIATMLRDDSTFYALLDQEGDPRITFREEGSPDSVFTGLHDFPAMLGWVHEKCIPLVREITFANGEEMTEEGIPLLIFFYNPDNPEQKELFKQKVETELADSKGVVNCVTANGVTFAHPLHHLGKTPKDLPVLAIDSFRHMYVFPNFEDIHTPGKMKQFVSDLQSGKLHREFHYGPDPVKKEDPPAPHAPQQGQPPAQQEAHAEKRSAPPESTFKNLQPAKSRYSLLGRHDEL